MAEPKHTYTCKFCKRTFRSCRTPKGSIVSQYCSRQCFANSYSEPSVMALNFWKKVNKTGGQGPKGDCWEWTSKRNKRGYGKIARFRIEYYAHRVSWEVNYGPIPDGLLVLHRCDNPPCVRPEHLFLGTQADNMRDMIKKGRRPYYVTRGNRRLSVNDETDICAQHAQGASRAALARSYNMSLGGINHVLIRNRT